MIRHKNILPNKRKGSRDVFGNDVQSDLCVIVQDDECVNNVISDEEEYEQSENDNETRKRSKKRTKMSQEEKALAVGESIRSRMGLTRPLLFSGKGKHMSDCKCASTVLNKGEDDWYEQPSGLGSQPSGLGGQSIQPSGLGCQPSGLGCQPSGLGSQPFGLGSQPSGLGS